MIVELLASNTAAKLIPYIIDKVVEYKKSKGADKEVEVLKNQLENYKEKTQLAEKELVQFKEIAQKLETRLGSEYISNNSYLYWSFDTIKQETSAFNIKVWTEKGEYHGARDISVTSRNQSYKIGDKINLYFSSEKDCYLTLLNLGSSGKMTMLFPNAIFQDNFIKGGETYAIPGQDYPFNYILSGPSGTERIKAIGTLNRINLMDMKFNKDEIFKTSTSTSRDISVVAKSVEKLEPEDLAIAVCEFGVS